MELVQQYPRVHTIVLWSGHSGTMAECSWAPGQRYLFGVGWGGNPLMKLCLMPERSACIHSVRSGQVCAVHKMITGFQSHSLTNVT